MHLEIRKIKKAFVTIKERQKDESEQGGRQEQMLKVV